MTEHIDRLYDLSNFHLERILNNNSEAKSICVLGTFPSSRLNDEHVLTEQAIVVLEKTAFTEADVHTETDETNNCDVINSTNDIEINPLNLSHRKYFSSETKLKQAFINDIYGNFLCYPIPEINSNLYLIFFLFV